MEIIELYDEDGQLVKFNLMDTFGMDEDEYVVLEPFDSDEFQYLLKVERIGKEINFRSIEDSNELKDAIDVYEELKREQKGD